MLSLLMTGTYSAQEHTSWRGVYCEGVSTFEEKRTTNRKDRRTKHKAEPPAWQQPACTFVQSANEFSERSTIGIISHERSHRS